MGAKQKEQKLNRLLSVSPLLVTVALNAVAAAVGILAMQYPDSDKLPSPYGLLLSVKGENMLILRDAQCLEELNYHPIQHPSG